MDKFTKQSGERLDFDIDYSDALKSDGDTLVNAVVVAQTAGITLDTTVVNTGAGVVKQWVSGGTSGQSYKLTCSAVTTLGRTIEVDFIIKIKDI